MRIRLLAVAVLSSVLAAGCASIPDDGAVRSAPAEQEEPVVSVFDPPGPTPGASAQEVVEGFITAMKAQPISSKTARDFLTEKAGDSWEPERQTIVFSDKIITTSGQRVELRLDSYASLGRRGEFTPLHGDDREFDLKLTKEHGQWRITNPPAAYLIDETRFQEHYQAVSLYYIADSRRFAIPEPVYLPVGDQLPTYAMNALLRGPEEGLGKVATSFLPAEADLEVSVRIDDDGVAEVRLTGEFDNLDVEARQLMSAQVVLTLQQVPGVQGVRLLVDGVPYDVSGANEVQSINAWNRLDPSVSSVPTTLYAMRGGQLAVVEDADVHAFAGPWDRPRTDIVDFAVDGEEQRIAVIDKARRTASVRSLAVNDGRSQTVLTGHNLLSPRFDPLGWLWIADARRTSTSVAAWRDGELRSIPIGELAGMRVSDISISRDGARFAAVAAPPQSKHPERDGALYVGYVRRSGKNHGPNELVGLRRVPLEEGTLTDMRSIAWRDATHLAVLADRGTNGLLPYTVAIDGSNVSGGVTAGQSTLPVDDAKSVAASGRISDPIYVSDADGGLWKLDSSQRWIDIGDANIEIARYAG
ncbi:MAG: LpqB family beta-propeller domain-containing protein [Actinomycetia bacterium]|nr:LpqB family beta-propeller domain-containing protein [Actinomycetes bacterium]